MPFFHKINIFKIKLNSSEFMDKKCGFAPVCDCRVALPKTIIVDIVSDPLEGYHLINVHHNPEGKKKIKIYRLSQIKHHTVSVSDFIRNIATFEIVRA